MKIAHICYQTWPTICGAVSRTEQVLLAQQQAGLDVVVVSGPFQESATSGVTKEHHAGVDYYRTITGFGGGFEFEANSFRRRFSRLLQIFRFSKQLLFILRFVRPDIIHCHSTFICGLAGIFAGLFMGVPVVYEVRSAWEMDTRGTTLFARLQRAFIYFMEWLVCKLSSRVVVIGAGLKSHYCCANAEIVYNSVDVLSDFSPPCPEGDRPRLGYIGSLVDYEGLETFFDALAILERRGFYPKTIIVGGGPLLENYVEYVEKNGIRDVEFVGRVPSEMVDKYYLDVDAVVLPRKNLPITNIVAGLKPVEAFSRKRLVIASNVGGMREFIRHGENGLLFEAGSAKDLADSIMRIFEDRERFLRLVDVAFEEYRACYTLSAMGGKYLRVYSGLVGGEI